MSITSIRIERDDDFAGEFATDADFTCFVAIYDAAELAHVARAFGLDESAVEVVVHRDTSGMTTQLSWLEDGSWTHDEGDLSAGERILEAMLREAMRQASDEAWQEYTSQQEAQARQTVINSARDLPEGWVIEADDGDSFAAFPADLREDKYGNGIGFGIFVTLDIGEYTDEPVRVCVIAATDGEPCSEDFTGPDAVEDAIAAAGAYVLAEEPKS